MVIFIAIRLCSFVMTRFIVFKSTENNSKSKFGTTSGCAIIHDTQKAPNRFSYSEQITLIAEREVQQLKAAGRQSPIRETLGEKREMAFYCDIIFCKQIMTHKKSNERFYATFIC